MTRRLRVRASGIAAVAAALLIFPVAAAVASTAGPAAQTSASPASAGATLLGDFGVGLLPHGNGFVPRAGGSSTQSGGSQAGGSQPQTGSAGSSQPQTGTAGSSSQGGWSGGSSGHRSTTTTTTAATPASTDQSAGLVLINTTLSWGSGEAAGTGLVIDASGIVVTNHHVVAGSTDVTVTVPATDQQYSAEVLGYDSTADVAVLRLDNASGLTTVTTDSATVSSGAQITAVGNANGGGQLLAAAGQVTATGADITVSDETGGNSSRLTDLIETDAQLVPGDSGGAMQEADGDVVGMNVAGSADQRQSVGYAIPIATVLDVAQQILAGQASATVQLGRSGALGVQVSPQWSGVAVVGVISDGPADQAGVTAGSVLTSLDGVSLTDSDSLTAILAQHAAGDQVSLTWTDQTGAARTATVTLGEAPLA